MRRHRLCHVDGTFTYTIVNVTVGLLIFDIEILGLVVLGGKIKNKKKKLFAHDVM